MVDRLHSPEHAGSVESEIGGWHLYGEGASHLSKVRSACTPGYRSRFRLYAAWLMVTTMTPCPFVRRLTPSGSSVGMSRVGLAFPTGFEPYPQQDLLLVPAA